MLPRRFLASALFALLSGACDSPSARTTVSPTPVASVPAPSASAPTLRTVVRPARAGKAEYLIVVLHGYGANADDLASIADALAPSVPHAEIVLPDGLEPVESSPTARQWFSIQGMGDEERAVRVGQAGATVSRWIDAQLAARGLGLDRVVVMGFSQGAMLSAWLAVHRAPPPLAVIALSGRFSDDSQAPKRAAAPPPVLWIHGSKDPRIPVSTVAASVAALEADGLPVTVKIHPDLGHGIDAPGVEEMRAFLMGSLARP